MPFCGNHCRLEQGHRIRLDLTQVDTDLQGEQRPKFASVPQGVTLVLPTR